MIFRVDNHEVVLEYEDDREWDLIEEFREETSYFVDGAWFDPDYKKGIWDGRVRLVEREGKTWFSPVGLLAEAMLFFDDWEVVDERAPLGESKPLRMNEKVIPNLRPYQERAKRAVLLDRGVRTGKGLLRLPTRSGKTVIAASIIAELGLRAVFVVNSDMLLRQTVEFFRKVIVSDDGDEELVGQFGGGTKEPGWITIASVQGLTRDVDKAEVQELLGSVDVAFFDEAHHLEAERWRWAMTECNARYKVGLSATIYLSRDGGTKKGSIWLVGTTGPIIYSISPSELINMGWLCTPEIKFLTAREPLHTVPPRSNWHTQYKKAIVQNEPRNAQIAEIARELVDEGHRVLVTASRLDHVDRLQRKMKAEGLRVSTVVGKTPPEERRVLCDAVRDGEADVLLGTVFGEAVDLPFLEAVIVADAMSSKILTMQRLRNLTPVDPETDRPLHAPLERPVVVPVIEFADFATSMMAKHSLARLRTYSEHEAFIVRWEADEGEGDWQDSA